MAQIAKKNLTIPKVNITRDIEITCWESNGIVLIREALQKAKAARDEVEAEAEELDMEVYARGAPVYRFFISARDYGLAEALSAKAIETVEETLAGYKATVKAL